MTDKLTICNNALDLVGQGNHIESLDEHTKEADLCKRNYDLQVERSLAKHNFSFARKDEVIKSERLLKEAVSLPWKYTYTIPTDVMKVLYLSDINEDSTSETVREDRIRFNFRQYEGARVLVTDMQAPFVMQYQSYVTDPELFSVEFTEALEYLIASRLAPALIHGTTGLQIGGTLLNQGLQFLAMAADQDAQQGADSTRDLRQPFFIRSRSGLIRND